MSEHMFSNTAEETEVAERKNSFNIRSCVHRIRIQVVLQSKYGLVQYLKRSRCHILVKEKYVDISERSIAAENTLFY